MILYIKKYFSALFHYHHFTACNASVVKSKSIHRHSSTTTPCPEKVFPIPFEVIYPKKHTSVVAENQDVCNGE